MLAVGRVHELALPDWLQAGLLHQPAYLVTPDLKAAIGQRCNQAPAAVALPTAYERGTQMHARFAKSRRDSTAPGFVKSSPAHAQKATSLCDR
jgi:hypothetical protein